MNTINLDEYFIKIPNGNIEIRDGRIKEKWIVGINYFLIAKFPTTQGMHEK